MKKIFEKIAACVMLTVMLCINLGSTASAGTEPSVQNKLLLTAGKSKLIKIEGNYIESKTFTSTDKKVAIVSKKGKVTAKKAGTCKINVMVQYRKTKSAGQLSVKQLQCTVKVKKADSDADSSAAAEPSGDISSKEAFVGQMAGFSMQLFQKSTADGIKKGENVLISPQSAIAALAMTANGAANDTLKEMEQVICGDMDIGDFNRYLSKYNRRLEKSKAVKFYSANSIWVRDTIKIKKNFLNKNKKYYNADVFSSPFDADAVNKINEWVKTNTDGMIDKLLDEISGNMVMYLINAIAFEGSWMEQYEDYQVRENEIFTNYQGKEQKVTMLCNSEDQYIKDDNAVGFVKPYKGGKYAFMAILPNKKVSVADYVSGLSGKKFLELYENRESRTVETEIPEFTYDYSKDLKNPLMEMGIKKAFSPQGDFTGMEEKGLLYINRVLHKTFIRLDRYGTKAAAVTAVEMKCGSAAPGTEEIPTVYLDRPFIYAIIDTETGLPIFAGAVNTIAD